MTDKPQGRPSSYTEEVGDLICERMCNGESLRAICDAVDMPNRATVFRWLAKAGVEGASESVISFRDQYTRAREEQADAIFDECLVIADDSTNDYMNVKDGEGGVSAKMNGENIQRSKLRIDTRKWMAGKMRPKKYGDKVDHTSSDGSMSPVGEASPSAKLAELLAAMKPKDAE